MRATLTRESLLCAVGAIARCADPSASMPILGHVRLTVRDGRLHLEATDLHVTGRASEPAADACDGERAVATDGHRLSRASEACAGWTLPQIAIPRDGVRRLIAILDGADGCEVATGSGHLHLRTGGAILSVKLGEVSLPDGVSHIAGMRLADRQHVVTCDRKALQAEVRALAKLAGGGRREPRGVILGWGAGTLRVTLDDPDLGEFQREVQADTRTSGATALEVRYLGEALAACTGPTVALGADEPDGDTPRPVLIAGAGEPVVVMPMRAGIDPARHIPQAQLQAPSEAEPAPAPETLPVPATDRSPDPLELILGGAHGTLETEVASQAPDGDCTDPSMPAPMPDLQRHGPDRALCDVLAVRRDGGPAETVSHAAKILRGADRVKGHDGAPSGPCEEPGSAGPAVSSPADRAPPSRRREAPIIPIEKAREKRSAALAGRPVMAIEPSDGETWSPCDKPGRYVRAGHPFDLDGARIAYYSDPSHTRDWVCVRRDGRDQWYTVTLPRRYRRSK